MNTSEVPTGSSRVVSALIAGLAIALPLGTIIWAFDLLRRVGILVYPEQFGAVMLGIATALVYLHVPAGAGRARSGPVPWYDALLALIGMATCLFVALRFPEVSTATFKTTSSLVAGFILIPLLLEGARRTAGLPIMLVAAAFLVLGLTAYLLPGDLMGRKVSVNSLASYLTWNTSAILGTPTMIVATVVVAFVLFGQGLFLSGGSGFFTDIAMALMGRFRGGQAKIAIIASALFGTISGSVVANVVSTGVVTIPMMKRAGYRPHVAAAVESVASTGGQLMPPVMGIAAFLMAEFLQVSYATIAMAALIPAVIYFAALFIQVDLEAARHGIARVPAADIPRTGDVLRAGWYIPIPFAILIAGIFWLNYSLDLSAIYALCAVLLSGVLLGYRGQQLRAASLLDVFRTTGLGVLDIFMIAPLAGIVIGVLNITGLSFSLALSLVALAGGSVLALLALTGAVSIVLGMGMPTVGVYILLATLVAPALIEIGLDPIAAHLFIFYYGMLSMITPPVAIGAFAAASISGSSPMRTGFAAVRFGWSAFVIPFLFIFSDTMLLRGGPVETGIDIVTALAAVWFIAAGFTGYSLRLIPVSTRIAYVLAGVGLLVPVNLFGGSHWLNLAGLGLGGLLVGSDWFQRRALSPGALAAGEGRT
ncbi:TRAP transporter permease [Mesobacterium pallidum]|uniref:TRAP transporter permease n=1 Tax=Mesobacterium pallidum TaxID=2872037 RepID=UPI001EE354D6|nr:TRAP transporter fused permease subunit [Mesobacterium pallidum]